MTLPSEAMGTAHDELQALARRHLLLHFSANGAFQRDRELPVIERGDGVHVVDTKGRRFLDGLSALYCQSLGYAYGDEMADAAARQLRRLGYWTNWSAAHPAAIELAAELAAVAPAGLQRAYFTNGGSESVEAAWKLTRQYHAIKGRPQRRKAIARVSAYHGVTLGALSLTGLEPMKEPFGPAAIEVRRVSNTNRFRHPQGDDDGKLAATLLIELERAIREEGADSIAAIIAEPIQNAGGSIPPPPGYWPGLRAIADAHDIVLIADEVITGFGRTGRMFGSELVGGRPDLMTLAKALTAGYAPMGAVLVSDKIAEAFLAEGQTLLHGITFGGHPVAAAIARTALDIYRRDRIVEHVQGLERHLERRMRELLDLPMVGDVRGAGFFWSAEMVKRRPDEPFTADERRRLVGELMPGLLQRAGLIARVDDRGYPVIQLAPPLVAEREDLDRMVDIVGAALQEAAPLMGVIG